MRISEHILRAHIWAGATVLPLLVKLLPLSALLALLTPPAGLRPYREVPQERIASMVNRRLRRPRNMKRRACLRRGLMLYHFLRLADLPAVLHFGVLPPSRDPQRLHGHCWVSVNGQNLAEEGGQPLAKLADFGQDRRHEARQIAP
jgi:hypothetical protein